MSMDPCKTLIWSYLGDYLLKDATFLAERLYADAKSDDSLHLLATCYYRSGQCKRAHHVLKMAGSNDIRCRYLLAKCCVEIKDFIEAETVLIGGSSFNQFNKSLDTLINEFGNQAHAALQLLGNIYRQRDQTSRSMQCFTSSLKCSPFLWSSFQSLCDMGEKVDSRSTFKPSSRQRMPNHSILTPLEAIISRGSTSSPSKSSRHDVSLATENVDPIQGSFVSPLLTSTVISKPLQNASNTALLRVNENDQPEGCPSIARRSNDNLRKVGRNLLGLSSSSPLTPNFGILPKDTPTCEQSTAFITPSPVSVVDTGPPMNAPVKRNLGLRNTRSSSNIGVTTTASPTVGTMLTPSPQNSNIPVAGVRRSSRLFGSVNTISSNSPKENRKGPRVQFAKPSVSPFTRKPKTSRTRKSLTQPLAQTVENIMPFSPQTPDSATTTNVFKESNKIQAYQPNGSLDNLLTVLQEIGTGYSSLSLYDCKNAIKSFESLLPSQLNTPWILYQVARAYYESACYPEALKAFKEMYILDPFYVEGTILYSTTLWMLRKEAALSSLATDLVEADKLSSEAWCAMGNCFSLQRDYDSAIKYFSHAVQLNPEFVYAFTLLGHEYVNIEEMEKALQCFRSATVLDERHYNAWYGIGMVHYKQENYRFAEMYFQRALDINPYSSVLLCHLAVVQQTLGKCEQALETIDNALQQNPKNTLCRYQKASFLYALERYEEARVILEELKSSAPKEPLVFLMLGQAYRELGDLQKAHTNFYWASSLDPKGSNCKIKEVISQSNGCTQTNESLINDQENTNDEEESMEQELDVMSFDNDSMNVHPLDNSSSQDSFF